jgi:mono/diheme cytochrome c family protein
MDENRKRSTNRAAHRRDAEDAEVTQRRTGLLRIERAGLVSLLMIGTAVLLWNRIGRAQENKLSAGEGSDIAAERCLACHGPEPILQQRLPRDKWVGEVDKMIRWGADVPADSKDKLVDYLAKNFFYHPILAPRMPGSLPEGDGKDAVEQSCLSCHGGEPISQQRLSRTQWNAEVDKMIRWGAEVSADQKTRLVEYLAKNFSNVK